MISGRKRVPEIEEIETLHHRYQQQAGWTASIRDHLTSQLTLPECPRILEVGCGTGVVLDSLNKALGKSQFYGIDIDPKPLRYAGGSTPQYAYAQSDAIALPFTDSTFDLVFCHFFLLWAKPMKEIMTEMVRVLSPGAPLIAFAEPDYGGRIDYPSELTQLGQWQEQALSQQGAHPRIGRELAHHFSAIGLKNITTGILGGEWDAQPTPDQEVDTLLHDLSMVSFTDTMALQSLLAVEREARENGTRILFVPTFYGIGYK